MPVSPSRLFRHKLLDFVVLRSTGFVFLLLLTTSDGRTYVKRSRNTKPVDLKTTKSSSFVGEGKKERRASSRPALVEVTGSSFHPKIISSIMSDIISKRQSFVLSRVILIHSRAFNAEMIILSKEKGGYYSGMKSIIHRFRTFDLLSL